MEKTRSLMKNQRNEIISRRPYTIVSGFLGAGKTTLINRLLKEPHGARLAVIVNEFGEIGLDGSLIRGGGENFVKMNNGCLCCALNEDLVATLMQLKTRDDFDAVVLETTGVAEPLPVAWAFQREGVAEAFRFAGIVTVADSLHFDGMIANAAETAIQIEQADYLYLAKTELAGEKLSARVADELVRMNPNARLVRDTDPDWVKLVFDTGGDAELGGRTPDAPTTGDSRRDHGADFASLSLNCTDSKIRRATVEEFLENLPKEVFRAKAIVNGDDGKPYAYHAVCGRVESYALKDRAGARAVVFVGRGFDGEKLRREWLALIR